MWYEKPASHFLSLDFVDSFDKIQKNEEEVFDCWFDSALSWSYLSRNDHQPPRRGRSVRLKRERSEESR